MQNSKLNIDIRLMRQAATDKIEDKYWVYKVEDDKAVSAQIQVANNNNGTEYIVLSGLKEGDVIVADGVGLVREGMDINTKG